MYSTIARGVVLASCAAIAFGVTTPVIARFGVGAFTTAALLYGGAAAMAGLLVAMSSSRGPRLRRTDLPRVIGVATCGAAIAPVLLAWGLVRTGGLVGSLLLGLEAAFTVALARAVYREPIGRRVLVASIVMIAGGAAIAVDMSSGGRWSALGALAIAAATLFWALDNTLTRPLSERDPLVVVAAKASIGAAMTTIGAISAGESLPALVPALVLVACGATGYGLSLRLYLVAQRLVGAARTGSVFALAPFVGAAVAIAIGERAITTWTVVAAVLFAIGIYLHVSEHHAHTHAHGDLDHEHAHRHDDGHHDHQHDPPIVGEHTHRHHHEPVQHDHEHALDLHHDHH